MSVEGGTPDEGDTPGAEPAPVVGPTELPTVLRTARGFRVHDPDLLAMRACAGLDEKGVVQQRGALSVGLLSLLAVAAGATGSILWWGNGFWLSLLAGVVGGLAVFLVVVVPLLLLLPDPLPAYRKLNGREPRVDVDDRRPRVLALCRIATDVAATRAWRDGRLDPDRLLPATVWSLVRLDAQIEADTARWQELHEVRVSQPTLDSVRARLDAAGADLDRAEANLGALLAVAHDLDAKAVRGTPDDPTSAAPRPATRDSVVAVEMSEAMLEHGRILRDLS